MKRLYALFLLILLVMAAVGIQLYRAQRENFQASVERELIGIALLKTDQIALWRQDLLLDGRRLMTRPLFRQFVDAWMQDPSPGRAAAVMDYLRGIDISNSFTDVLVADTTGRVRLRLAGAAEGALSPEAIDAAKNAVANRQPLLTDLHTDGPDGAPHLSVVVPLFDGSDPDAPLVAVVAFVQRADFFLYPLLAAWPVPTETAESFLARREGGEALYLSPLRHQPDSALAHRLPMDQVDVPAVQGLLGNPGVWPGVDYRGEAVLAASAAIPDSPWVLVAKIDQAEALRAWQLNFIMALLLLAALAVLACTGGMAAWQADRRRQAQALRERDALYHSVVKCMAEGTIVLDQDARIVAMNPAGLRILGLSPEQVLGRSADDGGWEAIREDGSPYPPDEFPGVFTLRTGQPHLGEAMGVRRPDGDWAWVEISAEPLTREGEARPHGVVATFRDIGALRARERELRASTERFDELAENSRTMTWEFDLEGRFLYVSPVSATLIGYAPEELVGKRTFYDLHPEEGRVAIKALALAQFALGESFRNIENPMLAKDGSIVWVSSSGVPVHGPDGAVVAYRGMDSDITERRRMEEALRDGEARFRALFDHSPVSTMIHDPVTGALLQANQAAWQSYGLDSEEALKSYCIWCAPPHSEAEARAWMQKAALEGAQRFEWRSKRANGEEFWESVQISPITLGGAVRIVSISLDITEQKRAMEALHVRSASLEAAANAVVITDAKGVIEWANPAFTRVTGYTLEECVGKNPRELVRSGEQDPGFYHEMWQRILAGEVWSGELVNRRKDGTFYAEEMTITPIRDASGRPTHFIAIKQDVSARKALEEEYRQAQKMESVGRLAGGVAHDFNNLLSVISGYTELALESLEDGNPLRKDLEQVKRAADRAANLTRQLLAFSRRQVLRPRLVDINHIVAESEKMLRRLIGEDIAFETNLAAAVAPVMTDPGQIEQVLMNLVVNARDAMPTGGRIAIETRDETVGKDQAGQHDPLPEGRCVRISVRDTGTGMDEKLIARIFDPFFTTKEQGKGTGLGLAMVYGVMKQSGGGVRVDSVPGRGTAFHLYLPCVEEELRDAEAGPKAASVRRGTETILLVEDDATLRAMGTRVLEAAGYTIIPASDGADALEKMAERGTVVDLLLTDVVMPGMSGKDLADALCARHPGLPVVYMSGYTDDILSNHGALHPGVLLLPKPFSPADLGRIVRQALDADLDAAAN